MFLQDSNILVIAYLGIVNKKDSHIVNVVRSELYELPRDTISYLRSLVRVQHNSPGNVQVIGVFSAILRDLHHAGTSQDCREARKQC